MINFSKPSTARTALCALLLGCTLGTGFTAAFADSAEVIAEIDGQPITRADLEASVADQLAQLDQQKSDLLEAALPQLIERKLIEAEAAKREIEVSELIATELEAKVEPVTDADVDAWYEANKARVQAPKEQVTEQIRGLLLQERSAPVQMALISSLKKSHAVKVFLEPERKDVFSSEAPFMGPADAPITIVEFSDFECPFCGSLLPEMDKVVETYGEKVKVVFRQFPLNSIHANAQKAAEASLCAEDQGKFWEMHDALFENRRELGVEALKAKAVSLELDADAFSECLDSNAKAEAVTADFSAGRSMGVNSTPSVFVNGRAVKVQRGQAFSQAISTVIEDELSRAGE